MCAETEAIRERCEAQYNNKVVGWGREATNGEQRARSPTKKSRNLLRNDRVELIKTRTRTKKTVISVQMTFFDVFHSNLTF